MRVGNLPGIMKRAILTLLLLGSASAAPFPYNLFYDFNGPTTVIAGHTTIFGMTPKLAFTYTVDPITSIFTVTGGTYTPQNNDNVTPEETPGGVGWTGNTLPAGMFGMLNAVRPFYAICSATPTTFLLYESSCSGNRTMVTDAGTGTHTMSLYPGGRSDQTYLTMDPTGFPVGTTFTYLYYNSTSECFQTAPTAMGKVYSPFEGQLCAYAAVPSNATPGSYTTTWQFCDSPSGGNCTNFTWVIQVIAPPTITYTPPTSAPAWDKSFWEGVMIARPCPGNGSSPAGACGNLTDPTSLSGPPNYCGPTLSNPQPINNLGAAVDASVSFYGWNLLFDNMAQYTGNMLYRTSCFQSAMGHGGILASSTLNGNILSTDTTITLNSASTFQPNQAFQFDGPAGEVAWCPTLTGLVYTGCIRGYQHAAAMHSNGDVANGAYGLSSVRDYVTYNCIGPGTGCTNTFSTYPYSLFRAARVFNDVSYFNAAVSLQNFVFLAFGPKPGFQVLRETSYGLDIATAIKRFANTSVTFYGPQRDFLYSFMLRTTEPDANNTRFPQQSYIAGGLAIHALISDWQTSQDNRAQYLVKRYLDLFWSHYYSVSMGAFINLEGPDRSPWCLQGTVWFVPLGGDGGCGQYLNQYQELGSMITEGFYWYWAMTGDDTYRSRGDALWANIFHDYGSNSFGASGKENSQVYYNTFNGQGFRTLTLSPFAQFGDPSTNPIGVYTGGNLRSAGNVARQ